jgi:hypothetical protein
MKTLMTAAILGLTGLAGVAGAEAQDVHKYRGGQEPRHERRVHRNFNRFRHRESAPRIERVWVPARFETRIVGYDHCGKPICGQVCISAGYWTTRACD